MARNIIIILLILILVGAAWFAFNRSNETTTSSRIGGDITQVEVQARQVLNRLSQVNQINISLDFFSNPSYRELIDYSEVVTIPAEAYTRENPFDDINVTIVQPNQTQDTQETEEEEG